MMQVCRTCGTSVWGSVPRSGSVAIRALPVLCSMTMSNQVQKPNERVQIVDESNNPTGTATRSDMRAKNLIHQCSFTMIFNSQVSLLPFQRNIATKLAKEYALHGDEISTMFALHRAICMCRSGSPLRRLTLLIMTPQQEAL